MDTAIKVGDKVRLLAWNEPVNGADPVPKYSGRVVMVTAINLGYQPGFIEFRRSGFLWMWPISRVKKVEA